MIHVDDNEPVQIRPDPDKLFLYHRQQLSAMLDGELSPDEARFMLRRLQHDTVLAACWERWQVCGDVLRGQRNDLLPPDFAQRVAQAVAGDAGEGGRDASVRLVRPRIARWGGGAAIAASVALLAVFASRQLPVPGQSPATGERTPLVAELAAPTAPEPAPPVARQPAGAAGRELADAVANAPGEVASASVPRRRPWRGSARRGRTRPPPSRRRRRRTARPSTSPWRRCPPRNRPRRRPPTTRSRCRRPVRRVPGRDRCCPRPVAIPFPVAAWPRARRYSNRSCPPRRRPCPGRRPPIRAKRPRRTRANPEPVACMMSAQRPRAAPPAAQAPGPRARPVLVESENPSR